MRLDNHIIIFFFILAPFTSSYAMEDLVPTGKAQENVTKTFMSPLSLLELEQIKLYSKNETREEVLFPRTFSLEERTSLIEKTQPQRDRYARIRNTANDMFNSSLILAEYHNSQKPQKDLWDDLHNKLKIKTFENYDREVHYINLDNVANYEIEKVTEEFNYSIKHLDNKRIISVIVFKPKNVSDTTPLGIFNHGGQPDKYFRPSSSNPILFAFAGLGYAIACPNYRGGSPEQHEEDMKAVIEHFQQQKFLNIVLSGISSGTTLNAKILDRPIMKSLSGLFLHTGLYGSDKVFDALLGVLPKLPIFIASGRLDGLVNFSTTMKYISALQDISENFRYFIVDRGGHHLIAENKSIDQDDFLLDTKKQYTKEEILNIVGDATRSGLKDKYNADEMMTYIYQLVEFLDNIAWGEIPESFRRPISYWEAPQPQGIDLMNKARMVQTIKYNKNQTLFGPSVLEMDEDLKNGPYTSSQSQLAILLGNEYDPNDMEKNIKIFLKKYDAEITSIRDEYSKRFDISNESWDLRIQNKLAENDFLLQAILEIFNKEIEYKGSYVLYHGAAPKAFYLYDIYTFLRRYINIQDPGQKRLRALDDAFIKILSADDLIEQMKRLQVKNPNNNGFNYLPGYQNVGLSAQWFLFGSYKYWMNSTFFRYFLEDSSGSEIDLQNILRSLFTAIGITDEKILEKSIARYNEIYTQYLDGNGGGLLQIFVSPKIIDEVAYISETFGYPLDLDIDKEPKLTHLPSKTVSSCIKDPLAFESTLKQNRENFKYQTGKDREEFSQNKPGLAYINSLEARFFMIAECMDDPQKIQILSYRKGVKDGYFPALDNQVAKDIPVWLDLKPKLGLAMTHHAPRLVKLQKYVEQGTAKSGANAKERKTFTLYDLLSAGKWDLARQWLLEHPEDIGIKIDAEGNPLLYQLLIDNKFHAAQWLLDHGCIANGANDQGYPILLDLIYEKNTEAVLFLLKNNADIDVKDHQFNNALIYACTNGLTDVVKALIAKKKETNCQEQEYLDYKDSDGNNALLHAINFGYEDIALALIEAGANIDVMNNDETTALMLACGVGLTEVVKVLIIEIKEMKIDFQAYLNHKNNYGFNALFGAILLGHEDIALTLIEEGAEIDIREDDSFETPLITASKFGLTKVVKALIKNNIAMSDDPKVYLNRKNKDRKNALLLALDNSHQETALVLIDAGADIEEKDKEFNNPILLASREGLMEVVKVLITKMKETNPRALKRYLNYKNIHGTYALWEAIFNKHQEIAIFLIEEGADICLRDNLLASLNGLTEVLKILITKMKEKNPGAFKICLDHKNIYGSYALGLALANCHQDAALALIEAGADINLSDKFDNMPLACASWYGLTKISNALITKASQEKSSEDFQAYLDNKNDLKKNPLMIAISRGHQDTALVLIKAGANIDITDDDGWTPLIFASKRGFTKVVEMLIAKKKETSPDEFSLYLNHYDKENKTALSLARENQNQEIITLLEAAGATK